MRWLDLRPNTSSGGILTIKEGAVLTWTPIAITTADGAANRSQHDFG